MEVLILILVLAIIIFGLYLNYRIVDKTGINGWWSLLAIIPLVNFIVIWLFAFKPWPAVDGAAAQRSAEGGGFQAPPPPPPPND